MDFEEYESLPTSDVGIHMTAGAVAGIMEHCVMFPIDSVKTRMQSLAPSPEASYRTIREGLMKMIHSEGILRPMGGVNAVIIGAGPAHAFYFSAYEGIKSRFSSNNSLHNHFVNAGAGCGATVLHDAVMVPADVIKQRMQMYNSPYSSCLDCIRKLYQAEGIKPFYRSFTTQMAMNIPFHAIHIVTYEKFQNVLNVKREYDPKAHIIAGGAAGGVAAALTTPLDMCKTVLNTQETSTLLHLQQSRVVGLTGALRTIYLMNGLPGFFKGMHARILYQMPGTAISWSIYELFKHQLSKVHRNDSVAPDSDSDLGSDSVVRETRSELETSGTTNMINVKEKHVILSPATNKTVERLRSLHMPGLTASCAAADDKFLSK